MIHEAVDCQTLVELVTDWLEGQLPDPTRGEFELHVATCAGCIAYVEQMRLTTQVLNQLDGVGVEPVDEQTRGDLLAIFRRRHE
jgi:anti-sigma factor RsiW